MIANIVIVKKRDCGWPQEGGIYLITDSGRSENGILPIFVEINPPVPNPGTFHRGPVQVDGDNLLDHQPYDDWLAGSSKERLENRQGDAWAVETFGMTAHRRLHTGECKGMSDVDQALAHLVACVAWDNRVLEYIQKLTIAGVSDIPKAAAPFSKVMRAAQDCVTNLHVKHLIQLTAAIWQLADAIPSKKSKEIVPDLCVVLALVNLPRDAIDLRDRRRSEYA